MCPFSILAFLQPTTVDKEPTFQHLEHNKYLDFQVEVSFLHLHNLAITS